MSIDVDTSQFTSAMEVFYNCNHWITDAVTTASSTLGGCGAMAGTDTGGQEWASSYDQVASDMIQAGADLGGSMAMVANLLNASLVNHEGADYGARVAAGPNYSEPDGDPDLAHSTERLQPGRLPSAAGGTGGQPDGWSWLVEHLEGFLWPDADTDKMRAAGKAWQDCSVSLASAGWSVDGAEATMSGQKSPEIPDVLAVCDELEQHCSDLGTAYYDIGKACIEYGNQVDEHHREIISTCEELLAWTVADEVTGAILSFFTFGAAEVAAQLVEAGIMAKYATKVISILKRLIELARAAARLIGKGLAKITEILAKLRRLLNAKALSALEKFGSAAAKERLAKVRDLLKLSEKGKGHTLERHVGLSDKELAERLAKNPKLKSASSYTDAGTATREIDRVLDSQSGAIKDWLAGSSGKLELDGDAGRVIGRTVSAGGAPLDATGLRVVLIRDASAPDGYTILTSFPK